MPERPPASVRLARASLAKRLQREEGYVGAGLSAGDDGRYEILVLVEHANCAASRKAPSEWQGVRVRVEVSGVPRRL